MTDPAAKEKSPLERALGIVTEMHAGEGVIGLLMFASVFLLLASYYLIKPVREALILTMDSGAEYKSYMSGVIAVLLVFLVPLYSKVSEKLPRNRLVVGVTLFFALNLVLFYVASLFDSVRPWLGLVFFAWIGIFNMMIVAQFWAFANDIYTEEQGKRVFVLIGLGQTFGAMAGAALAKVLVEPLGVYQMLALTAVILAAAGGLVQLVHVRVAALGAPPKKQQQAKEVPKGAFAMVFRVRYLLLLGLFSWIFTWVNTNGEYILGRLVQESSEAMLESGELANQAAAEAYVGGQFAELYLYVNILTFALQTFVVSRLVKYGGLRIAFFVFPLIALLDSTAIALVPIVAVVFWGKVAENGTDYSLNNTVRNILWLPTTTEMKYRAKQAVDTFFVRAGDVSSALLVALLATTYGLGVRWFAVTNVLLVALWIVLALYIVREFRRMSTEPDAAAVKK